MSKFRTIVMYFVLVMVTLALLFGINRVERRLDEQVAEHNLRFTGQIKNAPPVVVFTTVALGSFRGLVADLLWLRAGALQEKGNYFEMVQLARWITDLQPTFSGATAYLAWNMAYNISVTCSSYADRWRWVNEGIKLIRDQAIEYNPEDPILYKELAWIFQHKLGNIMDDANLYYKNRLAILITNILGSGNPNWQELAAAPKNVAEFMKLYPEDHRFWRVAKEAGFENFDAVFNAFRSAEPAALPVSITGPLENDPKLVTDLTAFFRAELLRDQLKLEPSTIVEINEKYGLMDWRVPESQAIYWATVGLERTPGHKDINCERIITQSLYEAFRAGKLLMIDERNFESIIVVPNLALVDSVYRTFTETQEYYEKDRTYSTFRSAKLNFLQEAITILYNYGKFSKAAEYYKILQQEEPGKWKASLESFVMDQWVEDVRDAAVKKASEIISGLIFRSINYLVYNDQDAAVANERIARYIYRKYAADLGRDDRTKLPSYSEMKKSVVESCLKIFPPAMVEVLKAKLEAERAAAEAETTPAGEQ